MSESKREEIDDVVHDYGRPYLPERNYLSRGYRAIGKPKCHFCTQCHTYYGTLKKKGLADRDFSDSKPPVPCVGDISKHRAIEQGDMTDEEYNLYNIYSDPVTFASAEFNWKPRWYQEEMLRCSSLRKVARAGRRTGKSECMAVMILYLLYTNKNYRILVICPFQSQVDRVFEIMRDLIGRSYTYKESAKFKISPPQTIVLENGSQVKGFSSGANSGGKSTQVRGQDAHAMFLDEMDYFGEDDLEAVLAILASHPDCKIWASSTPTGNRSNFFYWCIDKKFGFKEFHYISPEAPTWTDDTEELLRKQYVDEAYSREFLAEFGEESYGVYKNSDINNSLYDYDLEKCNYNDTCRYIVGVDWNQNAGTHIVVVECLRTGDGPHDIAYRLVDKVIIQRQEFTQITAVEEIIRMTHKWSADYIYVDAGYGATQVEMLRKFGKDNPKTKIADKVRPIEMGGKIEIRDPFTNKLVKKPAKPFIVGQSAKQVESGLCIFPRSEDTNAIISEEVESGEAVGLVQQMRMYRVEKISVSGAPTYTQGCDHTLTAWQCAMVGFVLEYSDIRKVVSSITVRFAGQFGERQDEDESEMTKRVKEMKKKYIPAPRNISTEVFSPFGGTLGALSRDKRAKEIETKRRQGRGRMPNFKPGNRSNF